MTCGDKSKKCLEHLPQDVQVGYGNLSGEKKCETCGKFMGPNAAHVCPQFDVQAQGRTITLRPYGGELPTGFRESVDMLSGPYIPLSEKDFEALANTGNDFFAAPNGRIFTIGEATQREENGHRKGYWLMPLKDDHQPDEYRRFCNSLTEMRQEANHLATSAQRVLNTVQILDDHRYQRGVDVLDSSLSCAALSMDEASAAYDGILEAIRDAWQEDYPAFNQLGVPVKTGLVLIQAGYHNGEIIYQHECSFPASSYYPDDLSLPTHVITEIGIGCYQVLACVEPDELTDLKDALYEERYDDVNLTAWYGGYAFYDCYGSHDYDEADEDV